MDIKHVRSEYEAEGLLEQDLPLSPFALFETWYSAASSHISDPNAFVLGTADAEGFPSQRTVLLKAFDELGFVFFTNYESRKGQELAVNPKVSMLFQWLPLHRQVIIEGSCEKTSREESKAYFSSRPEASQTSAAISEQSQSIASRAALESKVGELKRSLDGRAPLCPDNWGGYRIQANRFEFWQGRPNRLHDRIVYTNCGENWVMNRLQP